MSDRQQDFDNLWRDDDLWVIHKPHTKFPSRCLKTNDPVRGPLTELNVTFEPQPGLGRFL